MSSRRPGPLQRIEELAEASGATVRNIRVYQERGLLPPPIRQGRTALYGPDHLDRLSLILRLLNRGYTFATIEELLVAQQHGFTLAELLAVDSVRAERRPSVSRRRLTRTEARAVAGFDLPEDLLEMGEALGLVRKPDAVGHFFSDAYMDELFRELILIGVDEKGVDTMGRLFMEGQQMAAESMEVLVQTMRGAGMNQPAIEKRIGSILPRAGAAARVIFLAAAETLLADRHGHRRN
ncbi:MerR family transcriptional regulator [Rhodococcus sp. IEGM 1408]|uniref:MerR family transcriptional regulator n=1 Tax=Rhodococcus sp. IEGM 1408 TaxID=3082220 RepID=UPI002952BBCF|nr:MerR family transcriptional regulator [Rhodococcus sp. IEGM 1408]MDV8001575.1 MerR family transcriptional regulator [Rhodococcus sp. IEGM 1408]